MSLRHRLASSAGSILLVFALAFLMTIAAMVPVLALAYLFTNRDGASGMSALWNHPVFIYGSTIAQALGFIAASFVIHRRKINRPWSMGWEGGIRRSAAEWAKGSLVGISMLLAVFVAMSGSGAILRFEGQATLMPGAIVWNMALLALITVNEEVFVQGFAQGLLRHRLGRNASIIGSVCLFTLMHALNPGAFANMGLPLWNTALFGAVLALARQRSKGLWLPVGIHWAWYCGQGCLLGLPVSGTRVPSVWAPVLNEAGWLTGGAFGPEGSCLTTLVIVGTLVAGGIRERRRVQADQGRAARAANPNL